ncbi:MAG: hypothetical protein WBP41_14265, partial [Saprospiraceae bacterium]
MFTRNTTLNASLFILFLTFMTGKISAQCAPGEDLTPPVIVACPDNRDLEGCSTTDITSPSFSTTIATSSEAEFEGAPNNGIVTDNCPESLIVQYIDVATGTCPITVTRTWTITDAQGIPAAAPCIQTINVDDTTAPTGTSTASTTGTNACMTAAAGLFSFDALAAAGGYTDNCLGSVTAVETGTEVVTGT